MSTDQGERSANANSADHLITAQDQSRDKALGLDAGADDYLVKPIALEELVV